MNVAAGRSIEREETQRANITLSGVDLATFDPTMQLRFRSKIALRLGVPVALVTLANVAVSSPSGRRLQGSSPGITFTIIIAAAPGTEEVERFEALEKAAAADTGSNRRLTRSAMRQRV
jgi:hypothetical protein